MCTLTLFFVGVMVFFGKIYYGNTHYNEQYQLFQTSKEYFLKTSLEVGGVADYVGRFFTQFYLFPWAGGVIFASLLTLIVLGMQALMRGREGQMSMALSFVPSIIMLAFFCDENAMLASLVAFAATLWSAYGVVQIGRRSLRLIATYIATPVAFFFFGGFAFALPVIVLVTDYQRGERRLGVHCALLALLIILCPIVARYLTLYSFARLFLGIHYYRYPYPQLTPRIHWAGVVVAMLIISLHALVPQIKLKEQLTRWLPLSTTVVVLIAGVVLTCSRAQMKKEEVLRYDHYARTQNWSKIMQMATKLPPSNPISIQAMNLAMMKTGQLPDKMFHHYQKGTEGMIAPFIRDMTSPLISAEVYYHVGMINTAQHYVFEAQEAIPDFQLSSRCCLRLAETALICGNYELARKYITALQKTIFYKKKADQLMQLLGNEKAISKHREYGWLRSNRFKQDFIFSYTDMVSMLGRLVLDNKANRGASEYALMWLLVEKNLPRFVQLLSLAKDAGYKEMPVHYQEAYAYAWFMRNKSLQNIPSPVNPNILRQLENYIKDRSQNRPIEYMAKKYLNTYWFYHDYNK